MGGGLNEQHSAWEYAWADVVQRGKLTYCVEQTFFGYFFGTLIVDFPKITLQLYSNLDFFKSLTVEFYN